MNRNIGFYKSGTVGMEGVLEFMLNSKCFHLACTCAVHCVACQGKANYVNQNELTSNLKSDN